jgi:hypothetical protein
MNTRIKHFCSLIIFLSSIISASILIENILLKINFSIANASNADIQFPVTELGNCTDKDSCKSYCDKPENVEACLNFAEKNNLMNKKEIEMAKKFTEIGNGPGGCTTKDSCDRYCNDTNNINECISFAEKNGLMPPKELEEAKKVQQAIEKGIKPPACGGKEQCDVYCESSDHMEECITFAEAAGFLSPQEIQESKKVLSAIKKGVKPPACKGKEECDAYCGEETHFDECITFAEAAGLMNRQELEMAKKTKGKGPGGCKGKEECDAFCQNENNIETCTAFAIENGLMSKEDGEMMKKTGGKGPGDCRSKEECEAFCNNPQNEETCFNFGKDHGLISPEDLQRTEQGKEEIKKALNEAPPEVINCVSSELGNDAVEKSKNGSATPSRKFGDVMTRCFKENSKQQEMEENNRRKTEEQGGQMQPGQFQNNDNNQLPQAPRNNDDRRPMPQAPQNRIEPQNMLPRQDMAPGENNGENRILNPINPNMQQIPMNGINIIPMDPSNTQPNSPTDIQPQQPQNNMIQPQEMNEPSPPPSSSNASESLIGIVVNFLLKILK